MKEYKFKINGNEYVVAVNGIADGVADVTVNGVGYNVELADGFASPSTAAPAPAAQAAPAPAAAAASAAAAAPAAKPAGAGKAVKSPLPGVIIEVSVKEGQAVKAGQKVAVIEAMKMENEIAAESDGTVTAIHVNKGDSVLEGADIVTIA
jgi:biotin carboxyl carrier protein